MTAENPAPNPSTGARTNPDADDFWTQAKSTLDQFDANVGHRVTELLEANNRYQQEARDARAALKGGYQDRVHSFMLACFGADIAADGMERNHRFLEESLELVQALGCTASEAHQLVDYVFGRPIGEPNQEAGGVAVTLAALCNAHKIDMDIAGETELTRCWSKIDKIRAKQAAKPKHGPLPEASANRLTEGDIGRLWREHGGRQHGPHVETHYITEKGFWNFVSALKTRIRDRGEA
ncbi:hypothetical protein [Mesorhizobium sp. M1163]|uniref:hypothetical protein n=1 Tax=Mesorhizobium sp. M1163 TaxID=2957065 RepID=UPI0033373F2D